jgi:hypothetical protein
MRIEKIPEIDNELTGEIKQIIKDYPRQSANGIYYHLVSDHGYEFMEKKNWSQEEVYNIIRRMRDFGQIGWNDVTWIP